MAPFLAQHGISVVAVSSDSAASVAKHRARDGLSILLLADASLKAIDAYGLVLTSGIQFETWFVLGVPLGYPIGFRRMAIPTSLPVDEGGVIRWMDQADDYRLRGDRQRIEAAVASTFGE
jgi:hypothetical protein